MEKKTKELLRKRKKVRPASSSDSSSSSDSDSGSSSDSYSSSSSADKKGRHHRGKKGRPRRSSSSSGDEKLRKREKHGCHRKVDPKRTHLKRKIKESKTTKKRVLSPATLEKKHHHHQMLKERHQMREREKLRMGRPTSKEVTKSRSSPTKLKMERHHHHQLSPREKIIIRRERSPPLHQQQVPPQRGPKDIRHRLEDRRSERERADAARQKERDEALARCQERQRERERVAAKEKIRRERQDKEYDQREPRLLPRPAERELALAAARGQGSRDRSIEPHPEVRRSAHSHATSSHRQQQRGGVEPIYERGGSDYDREYEMRHSIDHERHASDVDREYMVIRRRTSRSPGGHYTERPRGTEREIYPDDERYERENYPQVRSSRGGAYVEEIPRRRERVGDEWDHDHRESASGHEPRDHHIRSEKHFHEKPHSRSVQSPHWEENWKLQQQGHPRQPPRKKGLPPQMIQGEEHWDEEVDYRPPLKKPPPPQEWGEVPPSHHHPAAVLGPRMKHELGPLKIIDGKPLPPHEGPPHPHVGAHPGPHIPPHPVLPHPGPHPGPHIGPPMSHPPHGKRWPQQEWRPRAPPPHGAEIRPMHPGPPGPRGPGFRHAAPMHRHPPPIGYNQERPHYPPRHPPPHMPPQHPHHPGQYHPRFPPKRQMVYTNPNLLANQKAAAAAAAQTKPGTIVTKSTASALINITPKVGLPQFAQAKKQDETKIQDGKQGASTEVTAGGNASDTKSQDSTADEIEPGEIKSSNENDSIETTDEKTSDANIIAEGEVVTRDDLSEISDEADDILKEEKNKAAAAAGISVIEKSANGNKDDTATEVDTQGDQTENDDLLDFEEISDGELEEETRKNLGDALGVDWASLVKDSKIVKCGPDEQNTTAKQKWQPHRVILDIGISLKYAGEEFAKNMINDAQMKLDAENSMVSSLSQVKKETTIVENNVKPDIKIKIEKDDDGNEIKTDFETEMNKTNIFDPVDEKDKNSTEILSQLACVQVAQRRNKEIKQNLVFNACGMNSRALSARKDLRLRRQLCGLPVREIDCSSRVVSDNMKALALKAFQKAVGEVK